MVSLESSVLYKKCISVAYLTDVSKECAGVYFGEYKINIFEAARRISKLVAAIWIIGWMVAVLNGNMQGNPIYFASVAFGGLLFILVITSIIGWIARRFMGIPGKKDRKKLN